VVSDKDRGTQRTTVGIQSTPALKGFERPTFTSSLQSRVTHHSTSYHILLGARGITLGIIVYGCGVREITGSGWNDHEEQIIKASVLGTRMLRMAHAGYKESEVVQLPVLVQIFPQRERLNVWRESLHRLAILVDDEL